MKTNSLKQFIADIRKIWRPLDSNLVIKSQILMKELAHSPVTESWLVELKETLTGSTELYRDPDHGFLLLAHTEKEGLYRAPHDHGSGWVIYVVQQGKMKMSTYALVSATNLIRRETYEVNPGQSQIYLPGDIHDTKCLSPSVLMFRLTSCDLKIELAEGRMQQYGNEA